MGGPRGCYAKWRKSKTNAAWFHVNVEPKKIKKETEQKQSHRHREQIYSCQMGRVLWGRVKKVKGLRRTNQYV